VISSTERSKPVDQVLGYFSIALTHRLNPYLTPKEASGTETIAYPPYVEAHPQSRDPVAPSRTESRHYENL
jgi:hypothetical protein